MRLRHRKECDISEAEAVDRLVDLIKEHGKWAEPESQDNLLYRLFFKGRKKS